MRYLFFHFFSMPQLFSSNNYKKAERRGPLFSKNHNTRPSKIRSFFRFVINGAIIGILGAGIAGVAFVSWVSRDLPDPNKIIDREIPLTTKMYDRTEKIVLYEIHGAEKRTAINLSEIPKYAIHTSEKTYTRKAKELILAHQIEKKFSKDEILKMYFNEIPYGSVVYGIEAASESFFGKSAKDLTLAEYAILAAI